VRRTGETPLLGRDEELAAVDGMLARARDRGDVLLLHGDPGIGKSAIAAAAVRRAGEAGATVLTTTGVPSAAELPYAGLQQLLWPVIDDTERLPRPLRAAMGEEEAPADPFRTGLAVLGLLGDAAERAPVLVVTEDAHWLDEPSSEVLGFVARRIDADPIAMLFTSRPEIPRSLRGAGVPSRRLAPLRDDAAEALLGVLDPALPATTRKRILDQARGNPLGLVELLAGAARVASEPELPDWLPLSTRLERTFSARVAELPQQTREALLVAALTDRADVREVLDAASRLGGAPIGMDVLSPAVAAALVEVAELRVRFAHPLVRSAIAQGGDATLRQAAHAALAVTLAGDPARAIRHRVAAATGPDDALAGELADVARRALGRGAVVTAAETLGRAAELTSGRPERGARLLDAAEMALEIGRDDLVERLIADAGPLALSPGDRSRRSWLQRASRRRAPEPAWFEAHLERADELAAAGDAARASQALLTVAFRAWWADVPSPLRDRMIARSTALPAGAPEVIGVVARALVDPAVHGPDVSAWLEGPAPEPLPGELLRLAAVACAVVGAFERGVVLGDLAIERLRARGRYGMLAPALVGRAWSGVFAGGWSTALAAAEEAAVVSQETAQPLWEVSARAAAGALTGLRGDLDAALALAGEAEAVLPPGAADGMRALIELARGLALLAAERPAEALAHLRRVLDGGTPWHADFVARWAVADAAAAAARANDFPAVRELAERAAALPRPSRHLAGSVAFARLLVAPEEKANAAAAAALAACVDVPALRARVQLAHGAQLRRWRRAGEARAALRAARDTFDALGMGAPAEQARAELRAAGEAVRSAGVEPAQVLSPQELQIARMAADGLSNREIGAALYLSHRTIGSHLYRIFPKLGVTSRGELRALLAAAQTV
jgi:DNA-binding CsgD family transcriptional regulator